LLPSHRPSEFTTFDNPFLISSTALLIIPAPVFTAGIFLAIDINLSFLPYIRFSVIPFLILSVKVAQLFLL
jgi:hypothetical protein